MAHANLNQGAANENTFMLTQIKEDYVRLDKVLGNGVLVYDDETPKNVFRQIIVFFSQYDIGSYFDIT